MSLHFGGPSVTPTNKLGFGGKISLAVGATWLIQPAGPYWVQIGTNSLLQIFDPIQATWITVGAGGTGMYIESDGVNYRLANLTGCAVSATVSNAGSGYVSVPTVTIASGNSIWRAVPGLIVNSVTISNGGSGYTYAPTVNFSVPPVGGVPAYGIAVLTSGAVSSVTMVSKGAGYTATPTISFVNDPREGVNGVSLGSGALGVPVMTGSGTIPAIVCVDPGSTQYSAAPAFTFAGGGGGVALAATVGIIAIAATDTSYIAS